MPRLPIPLALALLSACTWVTGADVDARRDEMDDDGDGYVLAQDCDDGDQAIHPGAAETWYDGVDGDCAADDDYDADADGFVAPASAGLPTQGVDGSGALPAGDCDDARAEVHPGAADAWYDGVDTDCDGTDDFDQDADGYVRDQDAGTPTTYAEGTGGLPAGDCDDLLAEVRPGAEDGWYDGVDTDCDGADDYDRDGDGFVRDEDVGATTTYAEGTGGLPGGDCDDGDAEVHAGAADTWYDDVDGDCAGDDDWDRDLDGHRDPRAPEGDGDDCDDGDPSAWPGATEVLGDGTDHDCDGQPSRFVLAALADADWSAPRDLRFTHNSATLFLSLAVTRATVAGTDYFDSALALTWDATDPLAAEPTLLAWFMNLVDPAFSLNQGHAFLASDDEVLGAFGLTYTSSGNRSLRMSGYDLATGTRFGANSPTSPDAPFADVALARGDDGMFHALGCEATDGVGRYMRATRAQLAISYDATESIPDLPADACALHFFDDPTGTLLHAQAAGLVTTPFDPGSETPFAETLGCGDGGDTGDTGDTGGCVDPSTVDPGVDAVDLAVLPDAGWILLADVGADAVVLVAPSGAELAIPVTDPMSARAALGPDGVLYVAFVDGRGVPGLAWGTGMDGFEQVLFDPGFTATEAAVEVSAAGEVLLFAAAGSEALAVGAALLP